MLSDRLNIALFRGLLSVPDEGRIGVFGARTSHDLGSLPKDRLDIVTRHFPAHAHFSDQGYRTMVAPEGPYALSIIAMPRARNEARRMVALANERSIGPIILDGQKTDGIDGMLKDLKKRSEVGEVISKAHGKFAVIEKADTSEWHDIGNRTVDSGFHTAPGVFSADGIDEGSALLAAALPKAMKGSVVDLGAGWGFLADAVLSRAGVNAVDLVEADHLALELARRNITDHRASFHWADALTYAPSEKVDHVVTNPPFHTGRAVDAALGQGFIQQAARILKPHGALWLVANRHLPYEATLKDAFAETRVLDETASFKLFQATSPRRPRKG